MKTDIIAAHNTPETISDAEKALSLYGLIRELSALKVSPILNVSKVNWFQAISRIHNDPQNIEIFYRDRMDSDVDNDTVLLKVHKPEYIKCPQPPKELDEWLLDGWDKFTKDVQVLDVIEHNHEIKSLFDESAPQSVWVEKFSDDKNRIEALKKWGEKRRVWVEKQKTIHLTRDLFSRLYQQHLDLERESETLEIVACAGFIKDRKTHDLNFPVLTRRVKTSFDAEKNTICIHDADVESELYTAIFQYIPDINVDAIEPLLRDLHENDYHPLDRNDTPEFLKILIRQLSSDSIFSPDDEFPGWNLENRLILFVNPSFIVRKRVDGTIKAVERIISTISETGYVPPHLCDIVSGGTIEIDEKDAEETVEEQLASVGGESADIFLSKEANKEQLEIARRIERYNAVLVQGPPGTGKTHTIANLMGHFLAQGKSILVTSHTKKALSVLKEKVSPGLQNLCVSILEDSNVDMEKSIDGITDYMGRHTSYELKKEKEIFARERKRIISELAETRKKLFAIINQECNSIVFDGEEISPSKAAAFVLANSQALSYIPGEVKLYSPLPLSADELNKLYQSNEDISRDDEIELSCQLPDPVQLISPHKFYSAYQILTQAQDKATSISAKNGWVCKANADSGKMSLNISGCHFQIEIPNEDALDKLEKRAKSFEGIESWMVQASVDSQKGDAYKERWYSLIEQIECTCKCADAVIGNAFCKEVLLNEEIDIEEIKDLVEKLRAHLEKKNRVSKFDMMVYSSLEKALHVATINGNQMQTVSDCDLVLNHIALIKSRNQCAKFWNALLTEHGAPVFSSLDSIEPERVAEKWIPVIRRALNWHKDEYVELIKEIDDAHIPTEMLFPENSLESEYVATSKKLEIAKKVVPDVISLCRCTIREIEYNEVISGSIIELRKSTRLASPVCNALLQAINDGDCTLYSEAYERLANLYSKYIIQSERKALISKLAVVAPQWSKAIEGRKGIHGGSNVPDDIYYAWKWKQYYGIISEITAAPYENLQEKSLCLSKEYRKVTAKYAELCAWEHLLSKTERDIDMKQALQGWKLTVKRIGKGTGKNAPMYRAQARQLMAKCQTAVPAWIMPVSKALESLDPRRNKFDVVIIDEASQSDITALAIAYMAKKLIIVGDDKQVSPMAVGIEVDKMNSLVHMYIKNKIPNAHLYNAKTSLYEIAMTSYPPLMLREHFRCVPEIIGFSNALSYDFKIKPLRDAGNSEIVPAVVNYRVSNGKRDGKENLVEAINIVALIKACIEQPEYQDKTMGVISLLGDEQAKKIQLLLSEHIDVAEIEKRRIICGNASHFQGDERNIIFLSMVDSHSDKGPLSLQGFGVDDANRKRYNVATSRAKDQLWVVNSLDSANDLKPGDIRKRLIDYALNPSALENKLEQIEREAESPFEVAVASSLTARGYHLIQQWKVGAYRLDMVAVCGRKKIAIECDGEKFHTDVRADMERQAILERLGWRFIRIRGSEYYSNPEKTMERVFAELAAQGIEPESSGDKLSAQKEPELLHRIKLYAAKYVEQFMAELKLPPDIETIGEALSADISAKVKSEQLPVFELSAKVEPCDERGEVASKPMLHTQTTIPYNAEKSSEAFFALKEQPEESVHEPLVGALSHMDMSKPKGTERTNVKGKKDERKRLSANDKALSGEELISALNQASIPYIDNRAQSGIVWVIYSQEYKEVFEKIISKGGNKFALEKRGSIATDNRPAWRVFI